jgi:iron complex outermembrane receptor protein
MKNVRGFSLAAALMAGLAATIGTSLPSAGYAQTGSLDDIVVTARRREESLQDIPLSITALDLDVIQEQNISNLRDVANLTAGFTFDEGLGYVDSRPSIRGQSNIRAASQPTMAVFVDGIDLPFRSGLNGESLDIERIEVVKGPQSAFFGRGVLSGAVNYVTRRPSTEETEGYIGVEAASDELYEVQGRFNLPVTDNFALAVSGRYSDFNGFYVNNLTGADTVGGQDTKTVVGSALWQVTDDFSAYLRVSYSDEQRNQMPRHIVPSNVQTGAAPNQVWLIGEARADENKITHNCDTCVGLDRQFTWTTLNLDWDIGIGTLSSLTGFSNTELLNDQDSDFEGISPDAPAGPPFFNNLRQIIARDIDVLSQEIRFTSPDDRPFQWLIGGYYYKQENDEVGESRVGIVPNEISLGPTAQSDEIETTAVFGQISYDFTEQLSASVEVRWNRDELSSFGTRDGEPFPLNETFDNVLPRFSVQYDANDNVMFYGTIAKGSKPGGFNTALGAGVGTLPLELIPFDEEEAWSYEAGIKSTLADGRLIINAAVFYIDWTDVQIDDQFTNTDNDPPTTIGFTSNAGEAEVEGFEIFLQAAATDNLDLSLGYSYNPARVINATDRRAAAAGIDTSGSRQLPFSSDWSLTGSARVHGNVGPEWSWYSQLNGRFEATQFASIANLAETGDRAFFDLLLGIENDNWSIQGYVNNLFDSRDAVSITPFVSAVNFARQFVVTVPDPRQVGVRAQFNFGGSAR